ncbi:MAG TPA: VOC family protein [Caulobacteraceae bacterium]|nr:VOC family protein [Caulobacteraceae bacterium]
MIDHVILTVSDFARSVRFYQQGLKPLGITDFVDFPGEDGHAHLKGFGEGGRFVFWLKEGEPRPEAVHVGFAARSQAEVKEFFDAAVAAGAGVKTPPGPQLQYRANYFATWVLDPDGHDIEVVNKTGQVE